MMAENSKPLEERVAALEREVAELRAAVRSRPAPTDIASQVPMIRAAWAAPRPSAEEWANILKQMGVTGEPMGAEALQAMLLAEGLDPNSNEFSRGIIEMREE